MHAMQVCNNERQSTAEQAASSKVSERMVALVAALSALAAG